MKEVYSATLLYCTSQVSQKTLSAQVLWVNPFPPKSAPVYYFTLSNSRRLGLRVQTSNSQLVSLYCTCIHDKGAGHKKQQTKCDSIQHCENKSIQQMPLRFIICISTQHSIIESSFLLQVLFKGLPLSTPPPFNVVCLRHTKTM